MDFLGMHVTFNKVAISEEKIAALKIHPVPGDFPVSSETIYGFRGAYATIYSTFFYIGTQHR